MKHRLLCCALLAAPGVARAQADTWRTEATYWTRAELAPGHTGFGGKGGICRSELQSLDGPFEPLLSLQAGVYARHRFTRLVAAQAELLYERRSLRGNGYNNVAGTEPASRLDYLALPVLLVGNVSERLSFHLGPQAAVLLAARYDGQSLDLSRSGYRRLDLGGVAGAELRAGPTHLGGRFTYSLLVLNAAGTAVTTDGQPLRVLPPANDYHSLTLQAYLSFDVARR